MADDYKDVPMGPIGATYIGDHKLALPAEIDRLNAENAELRRQLDSFAETYPHCENTLLRGQLEAAQERERELEETSLTAYWKRRAERAEAALAEAQAGAEPVDIPVGLINALRRQRQIDETGDEVGISRQAADEAADILSRPLYTAPPSLDLAIALTVEKCAKIAQELGQERSEQARLEESQSVKDHLSGKSAMAFVLAQRFRAQAPTLSAEVRRTVEDAERGRWMIKHAEWFRDDARDHMAICVPKGSDLSCYAMRETAIDKARGKG